MSLLPICAVVPQQDRTLLFVGLGAMGLLAQWFYWVEQVKWNFKPRLWRITSRIFLVLFVLIHGVLAPVSFPATSRTLSVIQKRVIEANESLPSGPEYKSQKFVLVNTPAYQLFISFGMLYRLLQGYFNPFKVLTAGNHPLILTHKDSHTVEVRAVNGSLTDLDTIFIGRKDYCMGQGEKVELDDVSIEVLEVNKCLPSAARFQFSVPLDDPSLIWFQWQDGRYIPFTLPAAGETTTIEGAQFTMG